MRSKRRRRRSDAFGEDASSEKNDDDEPEGVVHDNDMIRLMQGSGQTKQQRQKLRQQQRHLHGEITNLPDDNLMELNECRIKNNNLWKQVRFMKENVFDSKNVELIADKSALQAEKMVTVSLTLRGVLLIYYSFP